MSNPALIEYRSFKTKWNSFLWELGFGREKKKVNKQGHDFLNFSSGDEGEIYKVGSKNKIKLPKRKHFSLNFNSSEKRNTDTFDPQYLKDISERLSIVKNIHENSIKKPQRSWIKYAAAVALIGISTLYFSANKYFNFKEELEENPVKITSQLEKKVELGAPQIFSQNQYQTESTVEKKYSERKNAIKINHPLGGYDLAREKMIKNLRSGATIHVDMPAYSGINKEFIDVKLALTKNSNGTVTSKSI
jgi:hypothetical protein